MRMQVARKLYGWTYQRLFSPAWERWVRHRRPTLDYLAILEETQWLSRQEIQLLQLQNLKQLLSYAKDHVPYYRQLFAKVGLEPNEVRSAADLVALPPLTRELIRERYADLVSPEHLGRTIKKGTSGSTGVPLKFEYNLDSEAWRIAVRIRGYRWSGYQPGLPVFYYWAQAAPLAGALGRKITLDRALKREIYHDSMKQDEASMLDAVSAIRSHKPRVIVCYVQSCALLSRFILERGLRDWDDIPVLCGAEPLLPADRAVIAKAFGPHVYETYGSRETMLIASECSRHEGMHLQEENILTEIALDGRPVAAGEIGDVLVTDLHNYGMPLIRYQNGDTAVMMKDAPCGCGRELGRLARVDGRRADTMSDRNGKPIPGIVFHVLFADARQELINQFQAVQKPTGNVHLKIVRCPLFTDAAFKTVVGRFDQYLGGLPLSVEFCEKISPGKNGKFKSIVVERA